jgi:hypothetical protein
MLEKGLKKWTMVSIFVDRSRCENVRTGEGKGTAGGWWKPMELVRDLQLTVFFEVWPFDPLARVHFSNVVMESDSGQCSTRLGLHWIFGRRRKGTSGLTKMAGSFRKDGTTPGGEDGSGRRRWSRALQDISLQEYPRIWEDLHLRRVT